MVEEIILQRLISQLGPAGRIVTELLRENKRLQAENEDLRADNQRLQAEAEVKRVAKSHSPTKFRFRVLRWELGEMQIRPRDEPLGRTVPSLRLHCPPEDQPAGPPYWDVTSKRLITMLLPLLPQIVDSGAYIELNMSGGGWRNATSVTVRPA
jgi:hypothetical protein